MSNNDQSIVLQANNLKKVFHEASLHVDVLSDISLTVKRGEQVAIVGSSGTGKSTLMHLLGGLDKPTSGEVFVEGDNLANLSVKKLSRLRNEKLGFVYQFHHLLPEFTAVENVAMPLFIRHMNPRAAKKQASELLDKVGLSQRYKHRVAELSGGERQRVAIARALITKPVCILADEPTGNLDTTTAERVYGTMLELNRELGTSIVIVTHDPRMAEHMDRTLTIENGTLVELP